MDRVRFVMGTSSTLFNGGFLALNSSDSSSIITDAIQGLLADIGQDKNDVSQVPNPFANWDAQTNPVSSEINPNPLETAR
jgi:lysophospholipase